MPAALPIAFGASAVMGADAAHKAAKASKNQLKSQMQIWKQGREDVTTAYDQALAKLGGAGATAKQGISERGVEQTADMQSSAIDRGLFGTSFVDAGKRAIGSDVSRGRSAVDEQTAGMIAQVLQGKAGAMASLAGGQSGAIGQWQYSAGQPMDMLGWAKLFSGGSGGPANIGNPNQGLQGPGLGW